MSTRTIERSTGNAPTAGRHRITIREADNRHGRFEVTSTDGLTLPASEYASPIHGPVPAQ